MKRKQKTPKSFQRNQLMINKIGAAIKSSTLTMKRKINKN